jgi:hypothetical protein
LIIAYEKATDYEFSTTKFFFVNFSDEKLDEVWPFFHPRILKKGEHLYVPGDIATEVGFVVNGFF